MLLPLLWAACAIAAYIYAVEQHIPLSRAFAVLPAFLLEATFFYALARDRIRARLEKFPPAAVALALTLAAVAPYSAAYLAAGDFHWRAWWTIAALAAAASFWFVFLPPAPASDIFFLVFIALVWLSRILHPDYPNLSRIPLEALLQLMWFRTGLFAMVVIRRVQNVGFGFWPRKNEWKTGAVWFLIFLPIAFLLGRFVGFVGKPRVALGWERASLLSVGTFFGALWVLALGEEFFFRGLLQQWMTRWFGSEWAGLAGASVIFGAAHLWFRAFPNWRIAVLATVLGACCGMAFRQTRGIRAAMVTHALAVTVWRVFFG
ncbi:MAG TPA: CPBP family intramembrane glutamic endopeptidase [Bryobacteraceae bacterium]|nr:CPBP family intramembrane glutamic endopeptidase [Bryobacteraceae bacterium]